jgi:hypothetical protein
MLLRGLDSGPDRPESSYFIRFIANRNVYFDKHGDFHVHAHAHSYQSTDQYSAPNPIFDSHHYPYRVHDLDAFADVIAYLYAPTAANRYATADFYPAASAIRHPYPGASSSDRYIRASCYYTGIPRTVALSIECP